MRTTGPNSHRDVEHRGGAMETEGSSDADFVSLCNPTACRVGLAPQSVTGGRQRVPHDGGYSVGVTHIHA